MRGHTVQHAFKAYSLRFIKSWVSGGENEGFRVCSGVLGRYCSLKVIRTPFEFNTPDVQDQEDRVTNLYYKHIYFGGEMRYVGDGKCCLWPSRYIDVSRDRES